ncbi:type II secretion system protein N [Marinomonas sp. 2405UD68-3]|uniref:type II secretion system protein N n=1 Tax=Marinomonas sp. 2405UD68-3 TaxID=3391835 RepID=UPI0039C9770C
MISNVNKLNVLFRYSIVFLLISWLAIALGNTLWSWLNPPVYTFQLPPVSIGATTQKNEFDPISGNLFGFSVEQVETSKPVVKTKLKLLLKGVLPSDSQESSVAFISAQGHPDKMYRVGDSVSSGVTLQAVYTDRIILKRGINKEVLYFAKTNQSLLVEGGLPKVDRFSVNTITSSNGVENTKNSLLGNRSNARKTLGSPLIQDIVKLSPRELIDRYEKQFQNNPESLLSSAGLMATGSSYKVESGSPLTRVGLKAGDEVVSVNGQAVGNFSSDKTLGNVVRSKGVARIEIRRNNKRFFVNYAVK